MTSSALQDSLYVTHYRFKLFYLNTKTLLLMVDYTVLHDVMSNKISLKQICWLLIHTDF